MGAGFVGDRKVTVMRDEGSTICALRYSLVRGHEFTGKTVRMLLMNSMPVNAPEVRVKVKTPYYSGWLTAVALETPLFDLIIGNIPGATGGPCKDAATQTPGPVLSPHDYGEAPHTELVTQPLVGAAVITRAGARRKENVRPLVVESPGDLINSDDVRKEVEVDPSLHSVRKRLLEGSTYRVNDQVASYIKKRGLIYRQVESASGERKLQLVVPAKYREAVLKLGHCTILGGHMGRVKTLARIQANFFWPGIGQEVARFVRSCDICQKTVDRGRIKPAPLHPLPIITSPFERVAVDLVGPIEPRASDGSRYILTLVDFATRWPEAVPLRNIETSTVAEAMVGIFSRIGVPKQVLSDRGTQFTSAMMEEVLRLIACKGLRTTPYHPMGNGLCERFNGTLKKMLKRMAAEQPKEWPRFIAPLLFAYREAPQSSTKFSPFELVYGRTVRGPLHMLREIWDDDVPDPEVKTTYEYVIELQSRLKETCNLAKEELLKARAVQKGYYDRKSKLRRFSVGARCLVLLPTVSNKLLAQWKGPYEVTEKVNDLNYILMVDGQPKRFHINMLKEYFQPETAAGCTLGSAADDEKVRYLAWVKTYFSELQSQEVGAAVVINETDEEDGPITVSSRQTETLSDVKVGEQISAEERDQLASLLASYAEIFSDKPGSARVPPQQIELTNTNAIRVRPNSVPESRMKAVAEEIRDMEAAGVIERSKSPYCSPIVVVDKKDGGVRICGDYRRVNAVTRHDAEPMSDPQAIFATLASSRIFSKLDLTKGFFQIPLSEESSKVTAISTPNGLYHYRVLPFGMTNSPAIFNRVMREVMRDIEGVEMFVDDVLIHSPSFSQHLETLRVVFERLRQYNLTIKPSKCLIGHEKVPYLGHVIGGGQYGCQLDKIVKVRDAPTPQTKTQVKSFLGLAGYYRDYIPNFAVIAAPLHELLRKHAPNVVQWTEAQEEAFATLKSLLCKEPILQLPDPNKQYILRTDASKEGIGAVLMQESNGQVHPVSYYSRKLRAAERNYSTVEKELLAVVEGVKKYYFFLYGNRFVIETDHMPLASLKTSKNANARLMRWALYLQQFQFTVKYIKGQNNVGADFLSRLVAE